MAGSNIVFYESTDFDRLIVPTGPWDGSALESQESLEGEVIRMSYSFDDPSTSTLRIKRSYLQALKERDLEILYTGSGSELSGGDGRLFFVHGSELFTRGARNCCRLANRNRDIRYIAARSADGNVLAGIVAFNASRAGGRRTAASNWSRSSTDRSGCACQELRSRSAEASVRWMEVGP